LHEKRNSLWRNANVFTAARDGLTPVRDYEVVPGSADDLVNAVAGDRIDAVVTPAREYGVRREASIDRVVPKTSVERVDALPLVVYLERVGAAPAVDRVSALAPKQLIATAAAA